MESTCCGLPVVVVRRLAGYNVWEKQPGANFHGALDGFRIDRGALTGQQVRDLADGRAVLEED